MNLELDENERRFRDEVRAFLRDRLTPELIEGGRAATSIFCDPAYSLPWQRILNARGWAAPTWPAEFGGPGWSEMQQYIFAEDVCAGRRAKSRADGPAYGGAVHHASRQA